MLVILHILVWEKDERPVTKSSRETYYEKNLSWECKHQTFVLYSPFFIVFLWPLYYSYTLVIHVIPNRTSTPVGIEYQCWF